MNLTHDPYLAPGVEVAARSAGGNGQPRILALSGRIGRLRFCAYSIFFGAGVMLAMLCAAMALEFSGAMSDDRFDKISGAASLILMGAVLVFAKRRFNDLDHSSWFCLLMLVPVVDVLIFAMLILLPGSDTRNDYGVPPIKHPRALWLAFALPPLLFGLIQLLQRYDTDAPNPPAPRAAVDAARSQDGSMAPGPRSAAPR